METGECFHTKDISPLTLIVGRVLLRVVRAFDKPVLAVGDIAAAVTKRAFGWHEHVPGRLSVALLG